MEIFNIHIEEDNIDKEDYLLKLLKKLKNLQKNKIKVCKN